MSSTVGEHGTATVYPVHQIERRKPRAKKKPHILAFPIHTVCTYVPVSPSEHTMEFWRFYEMTLPQSEVSPVDIVEIDWLIWVFRSNDDRRLYLLPVTWILSNV